MKKRTPATKTKGEIEEVDFGEWEEELRPGKKPAGTFTMEELMTKYGLTNAQVSNRIRVITKEGRLRIHKYVDRKPNGFLVRMSSYEILPKKGRK